MDKEQATSKSSYADAVGSSSDKDDCNTCKIFAKILRQKFADVANDLKEILPSSTLSKLIPETKPTAQTSKPSTTPKPTHHQTTSKILQTHLLHLSLQRNLNPLMYSLLLILKISPMKSLNLPEDLELKNDL